MVPPMRIAQTLSRWSCALALGLTLASSLSAQTVYFQGFSSTSGLVLNGDATTTTTTDGTVLRLAAASTSNAGSVFTTTQFSTAGFSTAFQFRLTSPGGITDGVQTGADGLTFVLQSEGASSLGATGAGLGYDGIHNSVAVEFDTYLNSANSDPSTNHVGIDTGGSMISLATANVATRFDNGALWTAWIDYNGSTLEVRISDNGLRPTSALLAQSISISGTLDSGSAFIGFTGATGGAFENHDILNWNYSAVFVNGGVAAVPEPSAAWLLGLGVVAVGGRRLLRRGR